MEKNIFFLFLLLSLVFFSKSQEAIEENEEEEGYDLDDFTGENFFKASLKEYLVEHNLFDSERAIQRDEVRKIFLEVITEGDPESTPNYMEGIFQSLAEYFVNLYYKDRREVRGKDLYDLIDIGAISQKFEDMIGGSPFYDGYEEENNFDKRDVVGAPNPDV